MAIGRGYLGGVATGLVWGAVWMLTAGVAFMLISGAVTAPPVGAAAIAGLIGAGVYMATPVERRTPGLKGTAAIAIVLALTLLTAGRPLGLPLGEEAVYPKSSS
jgi:hypothetical protein